MIDSPSKRLLKEIFTKNTPFKDKTLESLKLPEYIRTAKILAKEDLCISGIESILDSIPKKLDLFITNFFKDGDKVYKGQCITLLEGPWKSLLSIEEPLLNWIGHFSGIATQTWHFSEKVKKTKCRILDTYKVNPLYGNLEKKAVRHGGGFNHRDNLSSAMILKENHLSLYEFNFKKAIENCLKQNPDLHLIVEASNLSHVQLIIKTKAHRVILNNFSNEEISEALNLIEKNGKSIEVEASGNITLNEVESVAFMGVDYISVDSITHSTPHANITQSMDF